MTLRVLVLTCDWMGQEMAEALATLDEVTVVGVFSSPPLRPRHLSRRLRRAWRREGPLGVIRAVLRRLTRRRPMGPDPEPVPGVSYRSFPNLHAPECLQAMRELAPDLCVVDGTYILRPSVFELPRLGSINLHCGRAPAYRGAPPVFWELFNGESEVGVTIHRVTADVDEGAILHQETFPLDSAPSDDAMVYVREVWRTMLRPHGLRMMREVVASLAAGRASEHAQTPGEGRTYRFPTHHDVRELKRRITHRRSARRGGA